MARPRGRSTRPQALRRAFAEEVARAVRYERFLLVKAAVCLLIVAGVVVLHERYLS